LLAAHEGTDTGKPHSHNQTLTVGLGITPSLLSSTLIAKFG
jgi:hypothetical protein